MKLFLFSNSFQFFILAIPRRVKSPPKKSGAFRAPGCFFQHPNISLICWDAVLLRESLRERGYGNPPPPPPPLQCEHGIWGTRARARTWEIHIPELRPGPARNQLGAGDGAGGGSKTANMRKKHVCRARFVKYTFPSSGRGRPGTSSGPVMGLAGGRKVRTWARNVGVEHGLSTFCVFCVFFDFPDFGSRKDPKKRSSWEPQNDQETLV